MIGTDYCTACGDPVSEVGPLNAEDECAPCVRRRTTFEWGQRDTAAAALGAILSVLTLTHSHDEIRAMVEVVLSGEGDNGPFVDSPPLGGGYAFSPAEWHRDTPEYAERRLAEWAAEDPEKARWFVESFEKRAGAKLDEPVLEIVEGGRLGADEAAWSAVADTARWALKLPGLSLVCHDEMIEMEQACLRAAGLPCEPRPTTREA